MFSLLYQVLVGVVLLWARVAHTQSLDATLCGKYDEGNSSVLPYSYSNNAWGNVTGLATGYQCMKLYDGGASWTATYQWGGDPTVVKAYPYMKAHPSNMPLQLNQISQLLVQADFRTYVTGTENASPAEQAQAYDSAGLIANVAMDLFLAPDAAGSSMVTPPIEIMIWPWWTPSILPLGYYESTPDRDTIEVNGVSWSLYHGINDPGQNVFSWLARSNITSMNGDYSPLVKYLYNTNYMSGDLWADQLQFGQEIKIANQETNFAVSVRELRVVRADEGETNIVPQTSPFPVPESLPPSPSSESNLVTPMTVEPAIPTTTTTTTTTTVPPAPSPEAPTSSSVVEEPAAPTTQVEQEPTPVPDVTTGMTPSESSPVPSLTTTTEPPPPPPPVTTTLATTTTTIVTEVPSSVLTTRSTTTRRITSIAAVASTTSSPTVPQETSATVEEAPTSTTSNPATSINSLPHSSWLLLLMGLVPGLI